MRAANALLLSVRKAYGMGRPTQFLRHQAKVFLYTICLILTILLSLVLVTVGRSVLNLCADYFHFSAILTDGFIELWSTLRFVFLGCIVFLALAVLYGLAQETRSVHYVWPGVLFFAHGLDGPLAAFFSLYVENAANYSSSTAPSAPSSCAAVAVSLGDHDDHGRGIQQRSDGNEDRAQLRRGYQNITRRAAEPENKA